MTNIDQGGRWSNANGVGIMYRYLFDSPTFTTSAVASSNMKNSQIIRIGRMSTKMQGLLSIMEGMPPMETLQVSHVGICMTFILTLTVMLLLDKK